MKLLVKVKLESKLSLKIKKIGILGGTFDPAHKGHLQISKQAKKRFDLKNVIWAITKKNPFKNKLYSTFDATCLKAPAWAESGEYFVFFKRPKLPS